ncbi:hypothetical protein [Streptomyces sp. NRRL S-455]|uniref:hypothetical protein n=1 Tax=Streptomyces sp. NRRL S-455 TaxID=1463908 RepID=UPI0004C1B5E6|nr:hypothetical protein [Streptomyces sp. NRRL S-455]
MGKVYGREPAVWLAAVGAVWQILSAFGLGFDPKLQSIITATVAAVLGIIVAVQVGDGIIAAVNGLIVAGVSLVAYFGFDWSTETQAQLVGAIMLLVAWFVTRPNVIAPQPADVSPPGKLVA